MQNTNYLLILCDQLSATALSAYGNTYSQTPNLDRLAAQSAVFDYTYTPCPLCQMQLDMYEPEGRTAVHSRAELPVLHLQQLIGFALGFSKQEVGFDRHVSAQLKLKLG